MKPEKKLVGFALLSPEERRARGALGGKRAHESGQAHRFTPEEARQAGKLGGHATKTKRAASHPKRPTNQESENEA